MLLCGSFTENQAFHKPGQKFHTSLLGSYENLHSSKKLEIKVTLPQSLCSS